MHGKTEVLTSLEDCRETVTKVGLLPGDVESRWCTYAVLTERLGLLQLRGRAPGTRLGELREECGAMGHGEPEGNWESKGVLSSRHRERRESSEGDLPWETSVLILPFVCGFQREKQAVALASQWQQSTTVCPLLGRWL
ncbi:hypothetical protein TraAM80_02596 [Trypanosoma rangeli]|uniref:Uncharacterized protein n=1 Tax=Trypanosoma rangeli TaxID=5698 RepID=A0A3S5IRT7_TRYRA|nr:uncharacterized protein TraAM80_02596 [Trypanosoma rangeli]RNF08753.1 hypothetical protein TraAM80_02596 [Trypanosoma rangeli]|eukprot:RNF08753.1 hypothetical protein TraAM80_02596 [Trypanosoma rangeli]